MLYQLLETCSSHGSGLSVGPTSHAKMLFFLSNYLEASKEKPMKALTLNGGEDAPPDYLNQ